MKHPFGQEGHIWRMEYGLLISYLSSFQQFAMDFYALSQSGDC
jgi:hypothetical protein